MPPLKIAKIRDKYQNTDTEPIKSERWFSKILLITSLFSLKFSFKLFLNKIFFKPFHTNSFSLKQINLEKAYFFVCSLILLHRETEIYMNKNSSLGIIREIFRQSVEIRWPLHWRSRQLGLQKLVLTQISGECRQSSQSA